MTNKPKAIGTKAETATRNALLRAGYSELEAHRNVLKGSQDEGDVWLRHPSLGLLLFEVKGGAAAKTASRGQIDKWWDETNVERANAKASYGFLVTQKAGVGLAHAEGWPVYVRWDDLMRLSWQQESAQRQRDSYPYPYPGSYDPGLYLRIYLGELLDLIG